MYLVKTLSNVDTIDALALQLEQLEGLVVSQDFFDPILDPPERAQALVLSAYAETSALADRAQTLLQGLGQEAEIERLPNTDWVAESQAGLPTVSAGPWRIHGSHEAAERGRARWHLKIDANTAFGTGHHETTKGCLLAFEDLRKKQNFHSVLDLGTGTGLLALAAARRGAKRVLATDIDPEAVRRARLNARANGLPKIGCQTAIGMTHASIRAAAPYDLIFANILAAPLINLAQDISQALAPGGQVILAGLIRPQRQAVEAAYKARDLQLVQRSQLGDWPTLVMQKGS